MTTPQRKRLNVILSNGLCVVSAKLKKNAPLATLFITDYTYNTRIMLDMDNKVVLANQDNIELTAKDIDNIITMLKKPEEKKNTQTNAT